MAQVYRDAMLFRWVSAARTLEETHHLSLHICVKNEQMHQLLIQFISYVWALHCHPHGAFLVRGDLNHHTPRH
jgi:hypothetical protein